MKRLFISVLIILICIQLFQQEYRPRFLIEGTGLFTDFSNINYRQGGGASFDIFLGKKVSTHYVAYFGKNYCEISPGVVSIPFLLAMANDDDEDTGTLEGLGIALFLVAISFENISMHFKLSENVFLSPSISLFRFKYFYDENNTYRKEFLSVSGGAGLKINQRIGRYVTMGAFTEGSILYTKNNPLGFTAGINVGVYLPGRNEVAGN